MHSDSHCPHPFSIVVIKQHSQGSYRRRSLLGPCFQNRKGIIVAKCGIKQQEAEGSHFRPKPRGKDSCRKMTQVFKLAQPASNDILLTRANPLILTNNTAIFVASVSMPKKVENISFKPAHHSLHIIEKLCFHKLRHTRRLFKLLRKENCSKSRDHAHL